MHQQHPSYHCTSLQELTHALRRFADEGANCVVSDLKIDAEAEAVAEDLRARGAKVATIACDVSDALQCQALVDQAVSALGSVDVFVNNAGIGFMMKPERNTKRPRLSA